jgi:hypothetical protein
MKECEYFSKEKSGRWVVLQCAAPDSFKCLNRNCQAGSGVNFDGAIDDYERVGVSDGNPE